MRPPTRRGVRHPYARDHLVFVTAASPHRASAQRLTLETIAEHTMPALQGAFRPLDRSGDAFIIWDPV
jgi:hypothetical protein